MEFLQEISKKLTATGQDVANKTAKMTEISRINSEIANTEKLMNQYLIVLGKEYYMANKQTSTLEEMEKVTQLRATLKSLKQRLIEVKGTVKCKKCGSDVHLSFAFCQCCGEPMAKINNTDTTDTTENTEDTSKKTEAKE